VCHSLNTHTHTLDNFSSVYCYEQIEETVYAYTVVWLLMFINNVIVLKMFRLFIGFIKNNEQRKKPFPLCVNPSEP